MDRGCPSYVLTNCTKIPLDTCQIRISFRVTRVYVARWTEIVCLANTNHTALGKHIRIAPYLAETFLKDDQDSSAGNEGLCAFPQSL